MHPRHRQPPGWRCNSVSHALYVGQAHPQNERRDCIYQIASPGRGLPMPGPFRPVNRPVALCYPCGVFNDRACPRFSPNCRSRQMIRHPAKITSAAPPSMVPVGTSSKNT